MKSRQEIERLSRQKQKNRLLLILLCSMVVFITAAIILINVIPDETNTTVKNDPPEILPGESIYNNYPIAYPTIQESQIQTIRITNKSSYANDYNSEDEAPSRFYVLNRDDLANGKFVLSYQDKDGNLKTHIPAIVEDDVSFDYESLYSIEQNDGYGRIYKLTYLCVAIELPYFTERIALAGDSAEDEERKFQLRGLGLDEPQCILEFTYKETLKDENGDPVKGEDGKNVQVLKSKRILIGDKNVTGVGYYFMVGEAVDGEIVYRPYIYSSMADYYNYAMLGFYSYVNSVLVSEGLSEDSSYEPYLTTDYKQWKNEVIDAPESVIPENSSVIIYADVLTPLEPTLDVAEDKKESGVLYDSETPADGYLREEAQKIEIDLSDKKKYASLIKALVGKKLGDFEEKLVITLTSNSKTLSFGEANSLNYEYKICKIEAILTDGEDITAAGTAVGANDRVRIAYYLTVDGKKVSNVPYHGVIDLSNTALDSVAVDKIRAASIGTLPEAENIILTVDYTEENSVPLSIKYVIDEVISIYNKDGSSANKVTKDSAVVYYRYALVIDGKNQGYNTGYIDFNEDKSENAENLKKKLLGKGLDRNLSITFYEYTAYCEFLLDYMTYEITKADYFVTSELISSFRFQNRSQRDPFYGESIYENTMKNKYGLYAINSSTCEAVVKMLGGIGDTTGTSEGLVGIETVAVGITPKVKEAYGLYAHTVYFELPRGIIVRDSGDSETVDDYTYYSTLGFTLYISDEIYDSDTKSYIRYVGSDLYDIVAKVSADKLVFLNHSFVDFWARRSLMMFNVSYLSEMKVEFMMDDLKGEYDFFIVGKNDSTFAVRVKQNHDHANGEECDCAPTDMSKYLQKIYQDKGLNAADLTAFYNESLKDEEGLIIYKDNILFSNTSTESAGVGYFRELMALLYAVQYEGVLSEEEQNIDFNTTAPIMRISIELDDENTSPYRHVYEFYRCSDRKVMVRLYEAELQNGELVMKSSGAVTDFYVSTFAFKKIVGGYFSLLNGERFDGEGSYPEISSVSK